MSTYELVVDARGDVGDREPTLLLGDRRMELDLVEQVAEFLDEVVVGRRIVGIEPIDRIDHLVGLLEQMGDEGLMGLLDVPGTLLAQQPGELVEADVLHADRGREFGDPQRRQVIGRHRAVELGPGGLDDPFVGRAERLEDHDPLVTGGAVDGELDLRQHPVGVGVGDEQRPALARCSGREPMTVDQADTLLDGIDAEPGPGHVEERHRGKDHEVDVVAPAQVPYGPLEYER